MLVEAGGGVAVVIPEGATGDVTVGEQTMSISDLASSGKTQACGELAGGIHGRNRLGGSALLECVARKAAVT